MCAASPVVLWPRNSEFVLNCKPTVRLRSGHVNKVELYMGGSGDGDPVYSFYEWFFVFLILQLLKFQRASPCTLDIVPGRMRWHFTSVQDVPGWTCSHFLIFKYYRFWTLGWSRVFSHNSMSVLTFFINFCPLRKFKRNPHQAHAVVLLWHRWWGLTVWLDVINIMFSSGQKEIWFNLKVVFWHICFPNGCYIIWFMKCFACKHTYIYI